MLSIAYCPTPQISEDAILRFCFGSDALFMGLRQMVVLEPEISTDFVRKCIEVNFFIIGMIFSNMSRDFTEKVVFKVSSNVHNPEIPSFLPRSSYLPIQKLALRRFQMHFECPYSVPILLMVHVKKLPPQCLMGLEQYVVGQDPLEISVQSDVRMHIHYVGGTFLSMRRAKVTDTSFIDMTLMGQHLLAIG